MNVHRTASRARHLTLGSTLGDHGRLVVITDFGKNGGDGTVVHLHFETGGKGRRVASELFWRKPELKGKHKPSRVYAKQETHNG